MPDPKPSFYNVMGVPLPVRDALVAPTNDYFRLMDGGSEACFSIDAGTHEWTFHRDVDVEFDIGYGRIHTVTIPAGTYAPEILPGKTVLRRREG